jgi:hypothetical protein
VVEPDFAIAVEVKRQDEPVLLAELDLWQYRLVRLRRIGLAVGALNGPVGEPAALAV